MALGAEVEVVIMDEPHAFIADFTLTIDHAWDVVLDLIRTGEPGELSDWCELPEGLDRQLRRGRQRP